MLRTAELPNVLLPERREAVGAPPTRVAATLPCREGAAPPLNEREDVARGAMVRALV